MKVSYDVEDEAPAKREYWFPNGVKQSATYGVISDNTIQATIRSSLTSDASELSLQE
ncbi:hypothetical protein [Vibrio lentus]|uniref:hypothetical protein n=1 Tax=Vibrio lentus TaxID=136468 RepID=UPI001A7E187E